MRLMNSYKVTCEKCKDTGMVNSNFEGIELMIPCWQCLSEYNLAFSAKEYENFLNEVMGEYNA